MAEDNLSELYLVSSTLRNDMSPIMYSSIWCKASHKALQSIILRNTKRQRRISRILNAADPAQSLCDSQDDHRRKGFTLIEMSIVLVVIGLLIGGVLVGQNLIKASEVRATVTQVEKFNTATNTFRDKYSALPGDLNSALAAQFGFAPRGQYAGGGDGNGVIEGTDCNCSGNGNGGIQGAGETAMFWVDLAKAGLIEGGFSTAAPYTLASTDVTGAAINNYLPQAKLGGGNYIYVWSGGMFNGTPLHNGLNYFGLSAVTDIASSSNYGFMSSNVGLTVAQAYAIDTKIDDGRPLSGRVTMYYISYGSYNEAPGGTYGASPTTCADNGNLGPSPPGPPAHYSIEVNNGAGINCAISIQFQ